MSQVQDEIGYFSASKKAKKIVADKKDAEQKSKNG